MSVSSWKENYVKNACIECKIKLVLRKNMELN